MKITLILPCYNEGKNLNKIAKDFSELKHLIKNINFELVIVNNGSTDNSSDILKSEEFLERSSKLINITHNIGYGHGIKKALRILKLISTHGLMAICKRH